MKLLALSLEQVKALTWELMYDNDIRPIPLEKTADVQAGLLYLGIKRACDHPKFKLERTPSEPVKYEALYFYDKTAEREDFEIVTLYPEYDISYLNRYYTSEVLDEITSEIQFGVLQLLYSVTPNTYFDHVVTVTVPHTEFLVVTVHEDDLEESDADDISDATDGGLHSETMFDGLYDT